MFSLFSGRSYLTRCTRQCVWSITHSARYCGTVHYSKPFYARPQSFPNNNSSNSNTNEDDFVDVDALAGMAAVHASSSGETSTAEVLGVDRQPIIPEGTEFSRMHIPLETPRKGQPLPRANSRAVQEEPGEKSGSGEDLSGSKKGFEKGEEEDDYVLERLPNVESELPYDDEEFAEMILKMEVEGAIDETWQDSRRAHLEDVKELTEVLKEMRVRDICCIDVSSKTSNFDYIMFATCEGPRHIHLAAWAAQEADALKRVSKVPRKKTDEQWEVVPVGRIVLNLMLEGIRQELSLERKWTVTKTMDPLANANAPVSEGRQVRSHGLWTLTLNLQDLEDFEVDYCKDVLMRQL